LKADQKPHQISGPLTAKATTDGLHCTCHGIHVTPIASSILPSGFMSLYGQSSDLWLAVRDASASDMGSLHIQEIERRPGGASKADWIDSLHRPALQLQQKLPHTGSTTGTVGILADIESEILGVIHARFCCGMAFKLLRAETVQTFEQCIAMFGGLQGLVNQFNQFVRLRNGVKNGAFHEADDHRRRYCIDSGRHV
jgi:hypothetical protein